MKAIVKGFTLIELLVVITIIGILATGATSVYTSQIQKARDTTRLNDLSALQASIEQVYQDTSEYPGSDSFFTEVWAYLERLPSDPKHGQNCNAGAGTVSCAYAYVTGPDNNTITQGEYELSSAFENSGNRSNRAANTVDNGNDDERIEKGLDVGNNNTTVAGGGAITVANGACTVAGATSGSAEGVIIVINGNPSSGECS